MSITDLYLFKAFKSYKKCYKYALMTYNACPQNKFYVV